MRRSMRRRSRTAQVLIISRACPHRRAPRHSGVPRFRSGRSAQSWPAARQCRDVRSPHHGAAAGRCRKEARRERRGPPHHHLHGGGPMYLADIRDAIATMGHRFVRIFTARVWEIADDDHFSRPRLAQAIGSSRAIWSGWHQVGTAQSVIAAGSRRRVEIEEPGAAGKPARSRPRAPPSCSATGTEIVCAWGAGKRSGEHFGYQEGTKEYKRAKSRSAFEVFSRENQTKSTRTVSGILQVSRIDLFLKPTYRKPMPSRKLQPHDLTKSSSQK